METMEVIKLGNPKLRLVSTSVPDSEFDQEPLINLVKCLYNKMRQHDGIGIAAPQIGVNKRIFVFGYENSKYDISIPDTVLINPTIKFITDEMEEDYESCLSIGSLQGKVSRYTHLFYRGFTEKGKIIEREVTGLHARVIQHEYDHLDGTMFLDRVTDTRSLMFPEELQKQNSNS